ncbi:MAG: hypothetical protein K0B05_01105 [Bacteroidales bacterium]|nr:hypothetical protein [Bacteroidales bacterium]
MNSIIRNLLIPVLAIVIINNAGAQTAVYTTNSGMTIGFGPGATWQQSDIANSRGAGFNFYLGSYIYKKENALLSLDWKIRFLGGGNQAFDHRINADGTYSNISYGFFNYDLELGLTLNRLKERTRIVLTAFAGPGITHGMTSTDLLDADGTPYDFSVIDPNDGRKQINEGLLELSDKEFETRLVNKAALLPTLGIYLGYQFSRSFSLGIEHKINFSLTERNSFTGVDMDNNIVTASAKDRNHYTSLGFRWNLGGATRPARRNTGSYISTPANSYRTTPARPVADPTPAVTVPPPVGEKAPPPVRTKEEPAASREKPAGIAQPEVRFVDPVSPLTVEKNVFSIRVQTRNLRTWNDVTVVVNGTTTSNFNLLPDGMVTTNLGLKEGENRVEVRGKNESGVASDVMTITYKKPVQPVKPTEITEEKQPPLPPVQKTEEPVQVEIKPDKPAEVISDKPCGIRINPGNSSWEFCLVTPSVTINRDSLTNRNFRYSGPAGSLYFLPIAGGGNAVVKGKEFTLKPGQYYLFTGNLAVTISTKNPGSMGQWSVCIISDREPLSGSGSNRPQSPCEEKQDEKNRRKEARLDDTGDL